MEQTPDSLTLPGQKHQLLIKTDSVAKRHLLNPKNNTNTRKGRRGNHKGFVDLKQVSKKRRQRSQIKEGKRGYIRKVFKKA